MSMKIYRERLNKYLITKKIKHQKSYKKYLKVETKRKRNNRRSYRLRKKQKKRQEVTTKGATHGGR